MGKLRSMKRQIIRERAGKGALKLQSKAFRRKVEERLKKARGES